MLPSSVADHQFLEDLEVNRLLSNHYIVLVTINAGSWVDVVGLLDDAGRPNHVGNVCDSPLMASVTDQVRAVFCSIFAEWFRISSRFANSAVSFCVTYRFPKFCHLFI